MALLLFGAYWLLWRPARAWIAAEVAAPLLVWADGPADERRFRIRPVGRVVQVVARSPRADDALAADSLGYRPPAGVEFLLPALLLAGYFPRRPYWLYLGFGHVVLSGFALACLAWGLANSIMGIRLFLLIDRYLIDAYSLAVPLIALVAAGVFRFDAFRDDASSAAADRDASTAA
jgi:hypothetical protein